MDPSPNALRPFRPAYWFGGFNGLTWMMIFGTPTVLLLEHLGASTLQVGLTASFVFVLYPLQILATKTLSRFGFQRQMVVAWSVRSFFLLVPLGLAIAAPETPAPWMASAVVLSIFLFCFFRAWGVAAHLPWLASIVPDALRGRFFATEGAIVSGVGVLALLGCSALFGLVPPYPAFRVVYAMAILGSVMAIASLLRLPPGERPAPSPIRKMASEAWSFCAGPGLFRQYLFITAVGAVVFSSFAAFTTYYLKTEGGVASSRILTFTAAQFGGQILGAWGVRRWIDRIVIRRFLQWPQVVFGAVYAYWLFVVVGEPSWLPGIALSYLFVGVAVGVSTTAHSTFLPELSTVEKRPISIAVFGAASGTLQGLGPILWGFVLDAGSGAPGVDADNFAIFFATGIVLAGVSWALLQRLPDTRAGISVG